MKVEAIDSAAAASKVMIVLPHAAAVPAALAAPHSAAGERILQLGPRRWLALSELAASAVIDSWTQRLGAGTRLVEDASARFATLRVSGAGARAFLAEQTSAPIAQETATPRALLGDVPVICCAFADDAVDLLVDRSVAHYARAWLERALS